MSEPAQAFDPWGPAAPTDIEWGLYQGFTCISCEQPIVMSRRHGWVDEATLMVRCSSTPAPDRRRNVWRGHAGGGPPRTGQLTLF